MLGLLACRVWTLPEGIGDTALELEPADTAAWPAPGARCGLKSDLVERNHTEGDTVTFTVSCANPLVTEITAVGLPEGARFDGRTYWWRTGPADGGRIDQVFAVSDGRSSVPDAETVTFWVADDPSAADDVPVVPAAYREEWGVPVVHIETAGSLSTDAWADATVTWQGRTYAAGVQIHGRTSSHYPKTSYALKFEEDALPIDAWGATRDHLLLVTTFDDNSYVRQKFVYDLWAAIAEYWGEPRLTPRSFFAVVYLDGRYHGLYLGLDRIDDEFLEQSGFDRRANLYKAVHGDANFALTDADGLAKTSLHQGYEKKEGEDDGFGDLDALVAFTGAAAPAELVAGDGLVLEEFMDWFLLVHYTAAEDSTSKNAYLYHPLEGGPFRYVPWDFNASWGQNWRTYRVGADFDDPFTGENRVFWAMQEDAATRDAMEARLSRMRADGPFALAWQIATLDAYYALIDRSAGRDWDTWGARYGEYSGWEEHRTGRDDWTDYEGERAYVYQWVRDRAAWFDALQPG